MKLKRNHPAFTLTEVLIALALVAVLLIGISRIFAITSQTISTGQALSKAVRTQKAIQQQISADIVGVLPTAADIRPYSGIMPLNMAGDPDAGMPFLTISSFRVPAYANIAEQRADAVQPAAFTTGPTATQFAARSAAIRGIDLDGNGTESTTTIATSGGETVPIYSYGVRNYRCDTIGFFARGSFQSQTGNSNLASGAAASTFQSELSSSEAYIWYGHLRIFNSDATRLDRSNAYGGPGDYLTPNATPLPNRNHQFADQFTLGRVQYVLADPIDHDNRPGSWPSGAGVNVSAYKDNPKGSDQAIQENNTVVAKDDPSKPVMFIQRNWTDPNSDYRPARAIASPFGYNDSIVLYKPDSATATTGRNRTVFGDDKVNGDTTRDTTAANMQANSLRTDVAGVDIKKARQRIRFLQNYDLGPNGLNDGAPNSGDDPSTAVGTSLDEWWVQLANGWTRRYWANPFVSTTQYDRTQPNINAKSIAQRQQIVATGVSQFIVEFAGDFVTQNPNGSLTTTVRNGGAVPDGITDFVAIPSGSGFIRQVRWYGLPRDVDGDGHIFTAQATSRSSVDVLPVSVFAGSNRYPFERQNRRLPTVPAIPTPTSAGDYATNVTEPTGADDPEGSAYFCVWGTQDFERVWDGGPTASPPVQYRGAYPTLIRFIVDVRDETGKLAEPVTQELVYQVPNELPSAVQ